MTQNLLVFDTEPTDDAIAVRFEPEFAANGVRYRETNEEISIGPARVPLKPVAGSAGERLRRPCPTGARDATTPRNQRRVVVSDPLSRARPDMEVNWDDDD